MALKMNKQIALKAFTILFLLGMVSAAWADTEDLIPTSFDNATWTGTPTNTAADIDDPSIDTSDYVYATLQNQVSATNSFSDPVNVQSGDTINSVTAYINSRLTGTPGNEYTQLVITCTSGTDTLNTGSNANWTTDSAANTNCVNYSDLAGATFTLTSIRVGGSGVTQYQASEVWLRIDYTPQATTTTTTLPTTTTSTTTTTTTSTTTTTLPTTTTSTSTTTTTTTLPTTTTTSTTTTTLPPTTTTTTSTTTTLPTTTTTTSTTTTTTSSTTTTTTSTTTTTLPTVCGADRPGGAITPDITVCASGCDYTTISAAFSAAATGNVICVYGSGSYGGFTFPSTGITLMGDDLANRPHITSTVTFNAGPPNGPYTNGPSVLDGFIIDSSSPSMYMKGWCDSSSVTIGNDVEVKNTLFDGGGKPAIKWEGGCPTIGPGNTFRNKLRTAIRLYTNAGYSGKAAIIQGNEFYGNGIDGGTNTAYAQIHTQTDATAGRYILIKDNYIHDAAYASGFGIAAGSDDNLYLTGNEVVDNPFAGFKLGTWGTKDDPDNPHTGQITISGETNYTFAGTAYTDGSPNKFYSNDRGGIVTSVVSTFSIIKNEIYDNAWGGIHTGWLEPIDGEFTWPGGSTPAQMTIRTNKVYGNGTGTDTAGGGIDVMYASGTIENNLVYENKYAGIRVGDGVLSGMTIRHNTVVDNGGGATLDRAVAGGGIVYHDGYDSGGTTPCYYCRPLGTIPLSINVKDNVIAYNTRAALAGISITNTVGSEERDYNLIYSNNPGAWFWSVDCGYPAAYPDYSQMNFRCMIGQYGFPILYWDNSTNPRTLKTQDPNDILDNPDFENRVNDDYRLKVGSPGDGTASDSGDMGAWGGSYPIDW